MHIINTPLNPLFDSKAPFCLVWMTSGVAVQALWLTIKAKKKFNAPCLCPRYSKQDLHLSPNKKTEPLGLRFQSRLST